MLDEYLCLGGTEIANNARAYGYAMSTGCPVSWFRCAPCESLHAAVNDWVPPEWRTIEYGVNLFPDPNITTLNFLGSSAEWSLTLPGDGSARSTRVSETAGRVLDLKIGAEMPHAGETVTLRFRTSSSHEIHAIVAARPDVTSATGELQIASVTIPVGEGVLEVTGPSYTGTAGAQSGFALLGTPPLAPVGASLDVSEITVTQRPQLTFTETRRNHAVSAGMYRSSTTGTVNNTRNGASTPSVVVATNLMRDPAARNAAVAGGAFIVTEATTGAVLTRVASPAALPGAEFAAHFQVSATTYRIGFVVGTALAASTQYTIRFRMAGNPTVAADGTTVPLAYRPNGPTNTTGQVIIGSYAVRATETVVQGTFTTLANAPTASAAIVFAQTNGRTTGGVLEITEVTLVAGPNIPVAVPVFFDGATPATTEYGYAWTGTANDSTSTATLLPVVVPNGTLRVTQTVAGNLTWWDSFSLRMASTTSATTANTLPVTPGQVVRVYAQWRGNDRRRIRFQYIWYDAAGVALGATVSAYSPLETTPAAGEWAEWAYELPPVPAGAAGVWLNINSGQPSNPPNVPIGFEAGDWMEFRQPQVSIDQELVPYFDGASLASDGYTQYQWLGTPWSSASRMLVAPPLPPLIPFFSGDTPNPSDLDDIFWMGTPNASTSMWLKQQLATPGHSTEPPYTAANIDRAPWYDAQFEPSSRFYGVWIISMENLSSSTRTAAVTEGILDGGVVGLARHATREIRVRVLLIAEGDDALEYGVAWLTSALATTDCASHGSACGAVDSNFFAYCPAPPDPTAFDNDGADTWDMELHAPRYLHNVTVTSGPLVEQKIKSSNQVHVGYIAEFTMVAATPFVYGVTNEVSLSISAPVLVQDIPFNLMPYPSAELAAGTVLVRTNFSTNPSVETDATGWAAGANVITPVPTGSRSTEVAAQGAASYKVEVTTTNSGTAGSLRAQQVVTLPAETAGQRFSVSMWGFSAVISGTAVLGDLRLVVEWLNGSSTVLRTDNIGTGPASGGAISGVGLTRPAGAVSARVYMFGDVTSWSTGAVIDLFADALAFTSP